MSKTVLWTALALALATVSASALAGSSKKNATTSSDIYLLCEGDRTSMDTRVNNNEEESQGKRYSEYRITPTTLFLLSTTGDDWDYSKPDTLGGTVPMKFTHKLERSDRYIKFRMKQVDDMTASIDPAKTTQTHALTITFDRSMSSYSLYETYTDVGYTNSRHVNSELGTCDKIDATKNQF